MTINSKQKGKRGELSVAHILQEHGFTDARRTAQYCGNTGDASDVVGIAGFHIEVKRSEKTEIWKWLNQANSDAKEDEIPIVVFRRNRAKWQVCLDFETFLDLLKNQGD